VVVILNEISDLLLKLESCYTIENLRRKCAAGGSIVVVNIAELRSDAIIITPAVGKGAPESMVDRKWPGRDTGT